ncbi:MAG: SpoIIE family protein phosphatase [Polyangiaceae bacterium]|nr:SpoIIE family protein phosphatase [Polyangiaceae bacterium]
MQSDPSSSSVRRRVGVFLITSGADTGRVVRVPHGAVVSFGRSHDCTVQLPDEGLSRLHSRCLRLGEAYMLDDNRSTNGTYVNGRRISSATQLVDGDAVGLGRATKLRFTIMDEGEAETLEELYLARRSGKSALITADLEQDLAQAREFQQRLLRQHPDLPGVEIDVLYQPVDQVGGDVYQLHVLSDGSLRVFVADAVGHGVQASLTTMLIVSEYEATRHLRSPAAALAALNGALVAKFAHARVQFTAACVDVRFREREIVFAAAGHPPPCVVRAGVFEELEASGPILGVVDDLVVPEATVDLAEGDHLLVFTDGCTEVFDGARVYGEEGLSRTARDAIAAREKVSDAVAAALSEFTRGKPLADDATLLCIALRTLATTVPV